MARAGPDHCPTLRAGDFGYRDWYLPPSTSQTSPSAIISNAFEEARRLFVAELGRDECEKIWSQKALTMNDVKNEVMKSSQKYHTSRSQTKTHKWLVRFSERVAYYGFVLDVLVQHHPEYVSLAWGAMKFLFSAVINHEELTKQIAKALSKIASVMPRTDLALVLYPTEKMQDAVARLYAHIMKFFQKAIRWYRKGRLSHAIGSIFSPWELSWKESLKEIDLQSREIDKLSGSASNAEQRDIHLEVTAHGTQLAAQGTQLATHGTQLAEIIALIKLQNVQIEILVNSASATRSIQEEIKVDLSSHKDMLQNLQLNQILSLQWLQSLPTSGESLGYCLSLQQRGKTSTKLSAMQITAMEQWAYKQKSSVMILKSKSASKTKHLLLDLVGLIRSSPQVILWALRFSNYWNTTITSIDILRMLVAQALQLRPDSTYGPSPVTSVHLREAVNEEDWLKTLGRVLDGVPEVYIVIDSDLLAFATRHDKNGGTKLLELMQQIITKTLVKVFVSSANVDEDRIQRTWEAHKWSQLVIDDASKVPEKRQRRQRMPIRSRRNVRR